MLESQQSSDGSREETLRRLGEGRCPTSPGMPCLKCSRSHRVFAAEKRNGRIQQKEAARARRGLAEDEHAAPKAQCALRPRLRAPKPRDPPPPTHAPDALWPRYVKSDVLLLKSIFDALDRDRSGTVQVPDLREALKQQQDSLRRVDRHNLADLEPVCPCLLPLPPPPAPRFHPNSAVGATHRTLRCACAAAPSSDGTGVAAPGRSRVPAPDEGRLPIRQPGRPRGFPELDVWRPNFEGVGLALSLNGFQTDKQRERPDHTRTIDTRPRPARATHGSRTTYLILYALRGWDRAPPPPPPLAETPLPLPGRAGAGALRPARAPPPPSTVLLSLCALCVCGTVGSRPLLGGCILYGFMCITVSSTLIDNTCRETETRVTCET